jgi:hypothetical protein
MLCVSKAFMPKLFKYLGSISLALQKKHILYFFGTTTLVNLLLLHHSLLLTVTQACKFFANLSFFMYQQILNRQFYQKFL